MHMRINPESSNHVHDLLKQFDFFNKQAAESAMADEKRIGSSSNNGEKPGVLKDSLPKETSDSSTLKP